MHRRAFLRTSGAAALGVPALCCAHTQAPHETAPAGLFLDALLDATRTPGLAAAGAVAGKPFLHVAGVRVSTGTTAVTADTFFSAASLTKPVFAMAVRALVRAGRLEWRKPLQDYMPLGLSGASAKITAEHVLSHGTGLVNWRFDPNAQLSSAFAPGARWQYSGEGYVLLQRVVETVVGEPLARHLNRVLLPSLGMTASTFIWTPEVEESSVAGHDSEGALLERSSTFYAKGAHAIATGAGIAPENMTYDAYIDAATKAKAFAMPVAVAPNAAGSLWTTIREYAAFLTRSIADHAAHAEEYTPRNRVNGQIAWTLSWGIDSSQGAPAFFHWGDGPGVKNFTWWQPATDTAVVIFTNGDHGASAYRVLLRRLLGKDPISPEWV